MLLLQVTEITGMESFFFFFYRDTCTQREEEAGGLLEPVYLLWDEGQNERESLKDNSPVLLL